MRYPFRGVGEGQDFDERPTEDLQARVAIILDFDRAVDQGIADFVDFLRHHEICAEEILVSQTIWVPRTVKAARAQP